MSQPTKHFLTVPRELPEKRVVEERVQDYGDVYLPFPRRKTAAAGVAVHGLWRAVLPVGVPAGQHYS